MIDESSTDYQRRMRYVEMDYATSLRVELVRFQALLKDALDQVEQRRESNQRLKEELAAWRLSLE